MSEGVNTRDFRGRFIYERNPKISYVSDSVCYYYSYSPEPRCLVETDFKRGNNEVGSRIVRNFESSLE